MNRLLLIRTSDKIVIRSRTSWKIVSVDANYNATTLLRIDRYQSR